MKLEVDVTCPHCRMKFRQRVEEMRLGRSRQCPHCGIRIEFTGDDGQKAQRAMDDLQRTIRNFGKIRL